MTIYNHPQYSSKRDPKKQSWQPCPFFRQPRRNLNYDITESKSLNEMNDDDEFIRFEYLSPIDHPDCKICEFPLFEPTRSGKCYSCSYK